MIDVTFILRVKALSKLKTHAFVVCSACSIFLSGCITQPVVPTVKIKSIFDSEQAFAALEKGDNEIRGSGLLRQQGGGVVTCAGNVVGLVPATPYAVERLRAVYGSSEGGFRSYAAGGLNFDPEETLYHAASKKTRCDAQGFFKFDQLKDGDYFVITWISWVIPGSNYGNNPQGGEIGQRVYVRNGETKEIVLTSQ